MLTSDLCDCRNAYVVEGTITVQSTNGDNKIN